MLKIKLNKLALPVLSLILVVSGCKPKAQDDCGFVQNVYGQRIAWRTKAPVDIYITEAVPVQLRPAIYRAVQTWESHLGQKIFNVSEDFTKVSPTPGKDGKNAIYFLSNWETERKSEQGRTSVYWAADQILEADIRINAADFSFYDQDPKNLVLASGPDMVHTQRVGEGFNFEALVLHELGHFLGLKHSAITGSVMVTHLAAFTDRTQLSESDALSMKCAY